jgi:hypothetical protein
MEGKTTAIIEQAARLVVEGKRYEINCLFQVNVDNQKLIEEGVFGMQMGNVLPYVVDESFSKQYRNASRGETKLRRSMKRLMHKMERRMAKDELKNGREINGPRILTGSY